MSGRTPWGQGGGRRRRRGLGRRKGAWADEEDGDERGYCSFLASADLTD